MSQAAALALGVVNRGAAFNRTARVYYSPWDQYVFVNSSDPGFSQLMAGTGDFCIEAFLNIVAESNQGLFVGFGRYAGFTDGATLPVWRVNIDNEIAGQSFGITGTNGSLTFTGSADPYPYPAYTLDTPAGMESEASLLEEWHHFAWIRKDNTLQLYVDGVPCERYVQSWSPTFGAYVDTGWINGKIDHFNNYSGPVTETAFEAGQTYMISYLNNTNWYPILGHAGSSGERFVATGPGSGVGFTPINVNTGEYDVVTDGSFVVGTAYVIKSLGTTDWSAVGAGSSAFIGQNFIATAVGGSGGGTALPTIVSTLTHMGGLSTGSPYLVAQNATYSGNATLNVGQTYWIATIGTTNWSNVGATQPYSIGQSFVATQAQTNSADDGVCVGVNWSTVGATSNPTPPPAVGAIFTATGPGDTSTITAGTNDATYKLTSATPVADGNFVVGTLYAVVSAGNTNWSAVGSTGVVASRFIATAAGTLGGTGTAAAVQAVDGYGDVSDGSFTITMTYMIKTAGTTDWTSIGANANTVGTVFSATATGAGGNGVAVQVTAVAGGTAIKDLGAGNAISFSGLPSMYSFGGPGGAPPSQEPYSCPYNNVFFWRNYRYTVGNAVYTPNGVNGSFTPPLWYEDLEPVTGTQILMVPGANITAPTTNGGTFTNEASPTTAIAIQNMWEGSGSATIVTLPLNNMGLTFPVIGAGTNTSASYTATNATTQDTTVNGRAPVIGSTFGSFTSGTPTLIRDTSSTALDVADKSFFIEGWVWMPVSPAVQPRVIITAQTTDSVGIIIGDSATSPTTVDMISLIAFPGNTVQYSANVIWARGQWNYFAIQREVTVATTQYVWFWWGVQGQYAATLLPTIGTQNSSIFNYTNAGAAGVSIGGISTGASASDLGINMLNVLVDAIVPNYASFGPATNSVGTGLAVGRGISMAYSIPTVTTATTLIMGFQGTNGGTTFNNQTS